MTWNEHIKAKADPELFSAVAEMLSRLWDYATKRVDVVRCRECKYLMFSDCYGECSKGHLGIVRPDDFCSYGERKEGAD